MSDKNLLSTVADHLPAGAAAAVMAGLAGGVAHWIARRKSPREGVMAMVVGGLTAVYVGPFASSIIGLPIVAMNYITGAQADPALFGAFVCGLGGVSIVELLQDFIDRRKRQVQSDAPLEDVPAPAAPTGEPEDGNNGAS